MEDDKRDLITQQKGNTQELSPEATEDFEEARGTYKDLIKIGKEGLGNSKDLAENSEHPMAVDTFAKLLNAISTVNSKLIDLHESKKKLSNSTQNNQSDGNITNNAVFVGDPKEFQRMLKEGFK